MALQQTANSRILLVPSSKDLGVAAIKQITRLEDGTEQEERVEWKISNKYYDALVHFQRASWRELSASLEKGIPAVVVIWEKGEDYEYILGRYTTDWESINAEVLLAVAVGDKPIETDAVEEFCSELGFEYVDADDENDGVGWDRVVEALQTIMWPTMKMKNRPTHRSQLSMERANKQSPDQAQAQKLVEKPEDPDPNDGWPTPNPLTSVPRGFDDDFTEFVSAPSVSKSEGDHISAVRGAETAPSSNLPVSASSERDQATGKGDDTEDFHVDDDGDYKELLDDEMPSKEEILLTSQRIFGQSLTGPSNDEEDHLEGGEEMGEFDLGSIMSALAGMKEEIAGITNEDEKRKAAARVALGLVWGLEGGRGM